MTELNILEQLLGCYFHQDWLEEFDNDISALDAIVNSEPSEYLQACIKEIDALLASALTEEELSIVVIQNIGCYFDPKSRGLGYDEWLRLVRNKFSQQA
jgi:hypothetical protein